MSRILEEMLKQRQGEMLSKDNFYVEKIGNLEVIMMKTTQEEENERIMAQRMLNEPTIKKHTFKSVSEENEEVEIILANSNPIRFKKDGTPDKRYIKKNGKR